MSLPSFTELGVLRKWKMKNPEKGLTFSRPNAKLKKLAKVLKRKVRSFDLLSGYSCPFAFDCRACAVPNGKTRTIMDHPNAKFRCYSAMQEVMYPETFEMRYRNLKILWNCYLDQDKARDLIIESLPIGDFVLRLHVAGDFFSYPYFKAWLDVARWMLYNREGSMIYGYTKALPYLLLNDSKLPENFRLTLSRGGTRDTMIKRCKKRGFHECVVVRSEEEAAERGLPLESGDDTMAYKANRDFAIVIHGIQPARGK